MLYGPVYLNKVLKFDIRSTGFSASLPYITAIFFIIGSGQISDRITCVSMKITLKLLVTIASSVLALGNLSIVFLTAENSVLVQIAFNLVVSFSGMCFVGTVKSLQMISQHFAPIMMVFMTIGACLCSIILPIVIALLVPDNTQGQWRVIFIGVSVIIFIGMLIFDLTAEAESRPWVKQAKSKNKIYNLPTNVPSLTSSKEDIMKKI
uniref:Major facilitator superfamily (MFS) profile domain-containing protein n=1 Tax=Acrobeloides nanus TaxID=290746 RepID=A0A914DXF7_9BILA